MKACFCPALLVVTGFSLFAAESGRPVPLFDGKTFAGWEGETNKTWRIEDGAFVGGSLTTAVPRNEFLATMRPYTNFILRVKFKLTGTEGFVNGGVQLRSERATNPTNEMVGYQCDLGEGWWGGLYDESRRNKVLVKPDDDAVKKALKPGDWNDYLIRCEGKRIRSWINDVPMVDYTEPDDAIPQRGRIGLQIHGGGKAEARYKDMNIEELSSAASLPRADANGNPIRRAPTGHVSNYDEPKVGAYTLPDPLKWISRPLNTTLSGRTGHINAPESDAGNSHVRDTTLSEHQGHIEVYELATVPDADTWLKMCRPGLIKVYETEIFGRVSDRAPKVKFEVTATEANALDGSAVRKQIVASFGDGADGPKVNLTLYLPVKAKAPVPVLLHVTFQGATNNANSPEPRFTEAGPVADILARGYGYALFRYTELEGDARATSLTGVRKLALAPGQTEPAADEWGTITAWAWGASRVLDYFETDRAVDAKRVALIGHSRIGKTALWTGARDPRFALVFASCSGEMGAALARRDYGETVDDVASNFPWWLAGNFQKYSSHWNDMPVDAHTLIALNAPRPVFITGGTQDQWADPKGEFLAMVAAGPVYRLLGKQDLGTSELPPLDTPLITGSLGFHYHTGGHAITPADWKAFLDFSDRHLKPTP